MSILDRFRQGDANSRAIDRLLSNGLNTWMISEPAEPMSKQDIKRRRLEAVKMHSDELMQVRNYKLMLDI